MNNLRYNITDKVPFPNILVYALQQTLAVFVATVLIANICQTPVDACLIGACVGTFIYQVITRFRSPMFISSCGATVSAVIGALAIGDGSNYLAVVVGGIIIMIVYTLFALFVKLRGIEAVSRILPPVVIGPITMVIGLNLAKFIPTYVMINGEHNNIGVIVAITTMIVVAISSHYCHGFWKTVPFLIGLLFGYCLSVILTLAGAAPLIDFGIFEQMTFFNIPDFSFLHWKSNALTWSDIGNIALLFIPVSICAICEHWADHCTLSNIIGTNLTINPGLSHTLLGDGIASCAGTILCGLPNTSYGESIATTGFSKVASVRVISVAAAMMGVLAFISPVQLFIASIPSCVFGGCAMILYGYIAASGLKTLIRSHIDLEDSRNLIIVCVILTVGVGGIWLFSESFAGVSLAMVLGVLLNFILKNHEKI